VVCVEVRDNALVQCATAYGTWRFLGQDGPNSLLRDARLNFGLSFFLRANLFCGFAVAFVDLCVVDEV
jgi:hypothetical protein